MPELPEVETIRRQLAPHVEGRRIVRVQIDDPRWSRPLAPRELEDALQGRRVESLGRRGKYLVWHLSDDVHLAQHLRMTGAVLLDPKPEPLHTRVRIDLEAEAAPGDRRPAALRHGRAAARGRCARSRSSTRAWASSRSTPSSRASTCARWRAGGCGPIKAFLLDQRQSRASATSTPTRRCSAPTSTRCARRASCTREQYELLRDGVVEALQAGIDARGASIDDFRHIDGVRASFQDRFLVHLREGEPCVRCGTTIVKMVVAGRGTYVCEHCQPRPRLRRRPAKRARIAA